MTNIQKRALISVIALFISIISITTLFWNYNTKHIVSSMSDNIIYNMQNNKYNEVASDFNKSNQISTISQEILGQEQSWVDEKISVLTSIIFQLDPTISSLWIANGDHKQLYIQHRESSHKLASILPITFDSIASLPTHKYYVDETNQETFFYKITIERVGRTPIIVGCNIKINELHTYIANKHKDGSGYAVIVDIDGTILLHPDSKLLNERICDQSTMASIRHTHQTKEVTRLKRISTYLNMEVGSSYYPTTICGMPFIIIINTPYLIEDRVNEFQLHTLWISLIMAFILGLIILVAQLFWRREYDLRRKAERVAIELQLQHVVNQINPHFLFNSLNSLYALINRNVSLAREFVLSLSKIYRHILKTRNETMVPLANEIEITKEYYFLQKIRFADLINLDIEINSNLEGHTIPVMSIQTIVENAIKHNIITPENPLHISIHTEQEHLVITNNYTPKLGNNADSLGVGLDLINSIYDQYYGLKIKIHQSEKSYICRLPLVSNKTKKR